MYWLKDTWGLLKWVSPFRYLRIKGYLLLPEAFRSLSRLSSALSAKASTLRSFLLDLVYSFYSVRNWVFAFNNADRIASILNFRSFGLVVNFVYDILGCLDKKSFSSKSSVWSFQGTIANFVRIRNCFAISVKRNVLQFQWRWWDSNSWPPACKAGALPTELHPHIFLEMECESTLNLRRSLFCLIFPKLLGLSGPFLSSESHWLAKTYWA